MTAERKLEILRALLSFDEREPDKTIGMWEHIYEHLRGSGLLLLYWGASFLEYDSRSRTPLKLRLTAELLGSDAIELWEWLERRLIANYELKEKAP
jgi:hypothetical protein